MCGIVGFIGKEQASPVVLRALTRLEYRGYDSAGVASIYDNEILLKKDVGKIAEVQGKYALDGLPGNIAIGHVRWATHGVVNVPNAHPHTDCEGKLAIVHNGIIENYQELRHQLEGEHHFVSETDTEVIGHLIESYMKNGDPLEKAVTATLGQLEGSYAMAVISVDDPGKIVAVRRSSPLVIGVGDGEYFVASDALSFLEKTNQVIFMEDDEMAVITDDGVMLYNKKGKQVKRKAVKVEWEWDQASKNGHDYFMLKEIIEGPEAIQSAATQDKKHVMDVAMNILRAKQVIIAACGSSRYAALIGRYLFSQLASKFCDVVMASEFQYFASSIDKHTVVIAVSQSGETLDVMEGVKLAKAKGAKIVSIVNVPGSSLARMSHKALYLNCGPEICVAATKSFISQLVIFYLLAFAMMNKLDQGVKKLKGLSVGINGSFAENSQSLMTLADKLYDQGNFYYIARGINFAMASEGALKLKELSYIHAEGMPAGELKHGTIALIEEGTPVVAICPNDETYHETISNAIETKARGAFIIGISDRYNEIYDEWIKVPEVEDIFYPLSVVLPLQLMAYYLAIRRGKDPDKPRNLAKSVTVK
ncbi:MAG: glutamine--fructose-6-phosphate transaminase (isomerizing) [Chloroflexi bacterium]|jgi:glutamine---fructose-6-phosphate transaminase (isomerizing)|nr:glutamine--fructose-6-phosphate transaminase (isomerizing) [Chloroflexota bacterium]MBT7080954.1 glutamine--fructose-6-phosphate transaminase (isomerizing) [Chloroflexota bacterium]MBT7290093.1 glutamine--fructose-6-phosphate transaminase (isomerizing) [Chloroflexota bacterium]